MNYILKSFLIIISILLTVSCASKTKKVEEANLGNVPAWVLDPKVDGTIAGVGIAPKSKGGLQFQIPQAEADARANIASQINTEVSRMTKNALRESRIDGFDDVENVFSQVTKNVVKKIPLMGARRINMYRDPVEGTLYIHMSIDNEMVAEYFEKNEKMFKNAVKNSDMTRDRINKAQKAVKKLFDELDEELDD